MDLHAELLGVRMSRNRTPGEPGMLNEELSGEPDLLSWDGGRNPGFLELEEIEALEVEEEAKEAFVEHVDDALKLYLREIQKTKLLSADEEKALAARIDLGDQAARDLMIISNLRLVVSIAKRQINRGLPFLDLSSAFFLMDTIEDTATVSAATLFEDRNRFHQVFKCFETLSSSEQTILTLRFGLGDKDPQTLEAVGKRFGVSRERIRQIEKKALEKLKKSVETGPDPEPFPRQAFRGEKGSKKPHCYTLEFRNEVVKSLRAQGLTQEAGAKKFAVPKGTLSVWMKTANPEFSVDTHYSAESSGILNPG
jgi:hypothetical protein